MIVFIGVKRLAKINIILLVFANLSIFSNQKQKTKIRKSSKTPNYNFGILAENQPE